MTRVRAQTELYMMGIDAKIESGPDLAYFEMSFSPSDELISLVRRFVGTFYLRVLSDPDLASRVALATHELLENAVRYSADGVALVRMEIRSPQTAPLVEIRTRNRAAKQHTSVLANRIDEMNSLGDPFKFYQQLMRKSAKDGIRGGLGLGRIAAEAEMTISCEILDNVVEVRARTIPEAT